MSDSTPLSDTDRGDFVAYLDGELRDEEAREIEARIARDPTARAELEAYRQAWAFLDLLPKPATSTDFAHRTVERLAVIRSDRPTGELPVPRPRFGILRPVLWGASVIAATIVGFVLTPARRFDFDSDPMIVHEPRVIENLPVYLAVEDLDFLKSLDHPDLFGESESPR